jgi:8-oxo-dGTP diphosphatase
MEYTLAFIFSKRREKVLLITKNRPDYQVGKLNGVGGKLERGETPLEGIIREVREETTLTIPATDWCFAGNIQGKDWKVWVYTTEYSGNLGDALSATDEQVVWYETNSLPAHCLQNLYWLIPFCKTKLEDVRLETLTTEYNV